MSVSDDIGNSRGFVTVAVASGVDAGVAVAAAAAALDAPLPEPAGTIVLLPPPPAPAALRAAVRALAGPRPSIARPPRGFGGVAAGAPGWRAVSLAGGARRFDRASVPGRLLDRPLALACPLPADAAAPTPIGLLAAFAHPRQRLAARAGGGPGALAELAAPLRPALVLLAGPSDGGVVVALTHDLIAAELVARAVLPTAPDAPGPWEHPAVQRATELDLGAPTPASIRVVAVGADAEALAAVVRRRIGVG